MPRMVVSIDGVVIKEFALTKERTTLGRRPYNDIVIDNLAISGEHAALHMAGNDVAVEDLRSTNGTYVNGKAVLRQELSNGDTLEVGKHKIRYYNEPVEQFDKTVVIKPGTLQVALPPRVSPAGPAPGASQGARISLENDVRHPVSVETHAPTQTGGLGANTIAHAADGASVQPNTSLSSTASASPSASKVPMAAIRVVSGAAAGREVPLTKVVTTVGKPGIAVAAVTRRHQGFVLSHVEGPQPPLLNGSPIGNSPVLLKDGDLLELAGTEMQFVYV